MRNGLRSAGKRRKPARLSRCSGGDDGSRSISFYATPAVIRPGSRATFCYGVNDAKKVRIEPPVENLSPSLSHCIEVTHATIPSTN